MALGEALARCPALTLVPADPVGVEEAWEATIGSLESIGAAVEPARPGLAYFETRPLRALHGGDAAVIAAAQRACQVAPDGRAAATREGRRSLGERHSHMRVGAGPTRFCALAAALAVRSRRPLALEDKEALRWLAGRPIELLGFRRETERLLEPLVRLDVRTLGELARLGRSALADRFGEAGAFAHGLALGEDTPLQPRLLEERLQETMGVGDASSGASLERVLGVLVDRLLARSERRGRTLRAVTLSARLLSGGGWRERVVFRQPLADRERISLALSLRLLLLPAPAASLGLSVERFGPPAGEQRALLEEAHAARMARLREAVAQIRAVAGEDAAMRAVCVDPDSRVPERRVVLTPLAG
jgi:protein ImuB